ncbi:TIGR04500 family putative peptide maturation system protein [Planomonospora sp. ID67723]|uniref:TIGR04500 family putative peptide maturation system protein n=1 Tax=Planomonospora sp. ID67723 TaxID=2738134 RepID=UPI0018C41CE5|nr:TIGR04500 family putative peptide maturation system protein [Planomonospora sp. ID67723]MBG0827829.1 TIGR04500 family putative peptide maturation system protein [Planomonospora sp. ID67723]
MSPETATPLETTAPQEAPRPPEGTTPPEDTTVTSGLLGDALRWLQELGGIAPEEARERLGGLRARHPGADMRLVWQREAATGDYHYDLLLPSAGGTVSLAFAPDRAIPWPLRGSQRSGEQVVLRVNGSDVEIEQVVSLLDVLWEDAGLAVRLLNACLVEQEVAASGADLPDGELQAAMDAFRRARGLLTARATEEWMAERGLGRARLEQIVAVEAKVAELRRRVTGDRVEDFFAEHGAGLDVLRVVRLRYGDRADADAAAARLRERSREAASEELGAFATGLATEAALAGLGTCRIEGNPRQDLATLHGADAREARAGAVLGPDRTGDGGFGVTVVLAVEPATLNPSMRSIVERRLFDDWLRERRRHAHVQWFWGSTARTDALDAVLKA